MKDLTWTLQSLHLKRIRFSEDVDEIVDFRFKLHKLPGQVASRSNDSNSRSDDLTFVRFRERLWIDTIVDVSRSLGRSAPRMGIWSGSMSPERVPKARGVFSSPRKYYVFFFASRSSLFALIRSRFARNSGETNDRSSAASAKSRVARIARSRCRLMTRFVSSTAR